LAKHSYNEIDVIAGCISNSRVHQELLYRKYFPKMMQMCIRYTSDQDKAMQICNDGFLKVFKNISQYQSKGSFEGWIRRIVFHSLSDFFKSEKKYMHFMVFEEKEKATQQNALDQIYYDDLLKMINELPNASARVFRLYAIEGFKHREIADTLNISVGTSKWHLAEARKIMKQLIVKYRKQTNYAR